MRASLVLGTAGHIDHGKTALIRALTGVDTDRLPEEKARGITIDLGFAPLDLAQGLRLSVVDVPGHEGLVRTMVAGASGIDLVLLVVAADEGVMPQTREHVAICDLLGIRRGVVALSKLDLAGEEVAALAAEEVRELLAATGLRGAPCIAVSSTTGMGLEELRSALARVASEAEPRTSRGWPPRLPVDRCFAVRGFGTVVTGTLVGGALAVGDAVEIHPSGRRGRVRGVQSHGVAAERALPGARCALNLQGIEVADVSRGEVVSLPGALVAAHSADASLTWLDAAPPCEGPTSVELLSGTAERRARVAPIGAALLRPGSTGFARIHLEGPPMPLLPGDRFVLRGFATTALGGATLGGGVVLDVAPPHRRRSDPVLRRDLEALARRDPESDLGVRVRRAGLAGAERARLQRETGLAPATLDAALARLARSGEASPAAGGLWLHTSALERLEGRLLAALARYHREEPLRPGMPSGALRGRLPGNVPRAAADLAIARLAQGGALRVEGDRVRLADHEPRLDPGRRAAAERLLAEARGAGLEPPAPREWCERLGLAPEALADLLAHLERQGSLVRAGDLWFDRAAVDALRERVRAHLARHGRLETPAYKELIGTTRRSAVPLMELFDAERLTLRSGDARILRGAG